MKLLLLCIFSALYAVESRKYSYDIEAESFKLYGEDLNSVLMRFRKTPEYLSILEDKVNGMKGQLELLMNQVLGYYLTLLREKVQEKLRGKGDERMRNLRRDFTSYFKQGYHYRNPGLHLRQGTEPEHGHPLDQYIKKRQGLPTERINSLKDLGFEYIGYAIHSMIEHMGTEDTSEHSMKPYGDPQGQGLKTTSTTKHEEHTVSPTEADVPVPDLEAETVPDTLRHAYRQKSV